MFHVMMKCSHNDVCKSFMNYPWNVVWYGVIHHRNAGHGSAGWIFLNAVSVCVCVCLQTLVNILYSVQCTFLHPLTYRAASIWNSQHNFQPPLPLSIGGHYIASTGGHYIPSTGGHYIASTGGQYIASTGGHYIASTGGHYIAVGISIKNYSIRYASQYGLFCFLNKKSNNLFCTALLDRHMYRCPPLPSPPAFTFIHIT